MEMFEQIIILENLFAAWREFRCGKRRKPDVQVFERHLEDEVFRLQAELRDGQYRHGPYHRFHMFDPKHRVIHKAMVRDRLVHHAVHRVLAPVFERSFILDSYSCQIGKGTHAAVRRLEVLARTVSRNYSEPCWALQFDIRKFFDSIDHAILLGILGQKVTCVRTHALLEEIVRSYTSTEIVGGGDSLIISMHIRVEGFRLGTSRRNSLRTCISMG
ncbi:MAG: reverse transcriptase domain-containing protein [Candidatus Uhrbacteria bacterium]